jgi:hypothetical protein
MAKSVIVPVVSTIDSRGINTAISQLGHLGASMKNLGRAVAGSFVVNKIGTFMADATIQARDYERNIAALGTVFGDMTPKMQQFVDASQSLGMSQSQAAQASTFLGSVLKQAGFPMQTVASQTQKLVGLATDLATTYGYDVSEALTGMTALFRGEYDPIEKFGVAMKQSEVNAILAANGQAHLTGAAQRNAQQMARLALLYQRTSDAQGAFSRQSDSLFVKQAKLTASFDNFKIAVGKNLIPVLADLAGKLEPLFVGLLPIMGEIFKKVGDIIANLAKAILPQASGGASIFTTAIMALLNVVNALIPFLNNMLVPILSITSAMKTYSLLTAAATLATRIFGVAAGGATVATEGFNAALKVNPIIFATSAIVGLTAAMIALNAAAGSSNPEAMFQNIPKTVEAKMREAGVNAATAYRKANPQDIQGAAEAGKKAQQAYLAAWRRESSKSFDTPGASLSDDFQKQLDALLKNFSGGSSPTAKTAGAVVKSWFDKLQEEVAKQQYANKLKKLGLSNALIESVIGSGDAWKQTADKILAGGAGYATKLQGLFNKTKDGLAEIAAAAEEAAKKAEEAKAFVDDVLKAFADVNLFKIGAASVGEYESAIASLFNSISDSLKSGLADKKLTQDAFTFLSDYASKQADILLQKAKAIDVLTKKIEIARSTTQSILGGVDITSALNSETTQVTESFKEMRDGIEITISRTVDVIKNNNIVDAYRTMVDKVKKFTKNLASLKAMGINPMLFKQILDSGADAGGAVAQAIVDGGSTTVNELNGLFTDLNDAASAIAADSTDLLYNLGEETTNGFISGLLAQKDALVKAAQTLVDSFQSAFQTQLNVAVGLQPGNMSAGLTGSGWAADVASANQANFTAFRRQEQAPVVVNVNAKVVKSDSELGLVVYDAIQAARRSGVVGSVTI